MMNVVIDAGRVMVCPAEALDEALAREGVDRKGLFEVAQGVYATPEALDEAPAREGVDRKRLVEVAEGVYATPEAIDAAPAREGADRKGLVELAQGVFATPEAIEAAKKPRKVFDFLPTLNTCGCKARRALEILFKK